MTRRRGADPMLQKRSRIYMLCSAVAIVVGSSGSALAAGPTQRASVGPSGIQGNGPSSVAALSTTGRFVAYWSDATNLVPGDTNNANDIFVYDRESGKTQRVNVGSSGIQAKGQSYNPALSADGRFVAFESYAGNLVPKDTNGRGDVFMRDRKMGTTQRVSQGPGGIQTNGDSEEPTMSADGRFVAFISSASNLVAGDTNRRRDVFVHDRQTGTTQCVSLGRGGVQSNGHSDIPKISANGRFVMFSSPASNLVMGDTNGVSDVFVRDLKLSVTQRVSLGQGGIQGTDASYGDAISADGRFVVFSSDEANFVPGDTNGVGDTFVRDRQTGTTERVSLGPDSAQGFSGQSNGASISADGQFVLFISWVDTFVPGDTNNQGDVFLRNRRAGTTRRVSLGSGGVQSNGDSYPAVLSADGRSVAFTSYASNLVRGDTNGQLDVFVRTLKP